MKFENTTPATEKELSAVSARWEGHALPAGVGENIEQVGQELLQGYMKIIDRLGARIAAVPESTWESFGRELSYVFVPALVRCFYIGYDLASLKLPRAEGTRYLLGATRAVSDLAKETIGQLYEGAIIELQESLDLGSQFEVLLMGCANDMCMLGIAKYHQNGR